MLNQYTPSSVLTATALAVGIGMAAFSPEAHACPSCNDSFMHELKTDRADTAVGRDLLAAVANQQGLPLGSASQAITANSVAAARGGDVDLDSIFDGAEFIEIIQRDEALDIPSTSFVPQDVEPDVEFTIRLDEGETYIGQGVIYDGFVSDGKIPGPTLRVTEGDIVRITVENTGTVPHGASIHAADTQTSKYIGDIGPGQSKSVTFRANMPGVYMWHCAPGGHAIPMHVLFGQYGMIVVDPKETKYKLEEKLGHGPDLELYMIQHEFYASGKDALEGNPLYTAFNGKLFRYVEEPITAKPGDYVRINFLNIGPNLVSTFHLVGIIWDFVYWQGHPEAWMPGGQTVTAGPSDSWVIEFRVPPDEGAYLMLSHAVGSTARGAIGVLVADAGADTPKTILADGPEYTSEELEEIRESAVRAISPFAPAERLKGVPAEPDRPVSYGADVDEVFVQIIGNSYYPKIIEIEPGTRVTWVNEDVFTYMAGEFSGIHNAVAVDGPELFATRMLGHAEADSFTFTEPGEYTYICTPHPYMKGNVIVRDHDD